MGWIWPTEALDRQIHLVLLQDAQNILYVTEKLWAYNKTGRSAVPTNIHSVKRAKHLLLLHKYWWCFPRSFLCPQAYTLGIDIIYKLRFFFFFFLNVPLLKSKEKRRLTVIAKRTLYLYCTLKKIHMYCKITILSRNKNKS